MNNASNQKLCIKILTADVLGRADDFGFVFVVFEVVVLVLAGSLVVVPTALDLCLLYTSDAADE